MIQIDIPMPKNCYDCPFSDDSGDYPYCWVLHQNRGYSFDRRTKRFPNCPLKPAEELKADESCTSARKRTYGPDMSEMCRTTHSCRTGCRLQWRTNYKIHKIKTLLWREQ